MQGSTQTYTQSYTMGATMGTTLTKKLSATLAAALMASMAFASIPAFGSAADEALLTQQWSESARRLATEAARSVFGDKLPLRVEVSTGALDPRLRLAPCQRVETFIPAGHRPWGRSRLGLRCAQGPVAWSVSVALNVRVYAPALVVSQALPAGTVISAQHLRTVEVDWAERDSPVVALESLALGRTLASPMAAGAALRQEHLKKRQWFDAGDPVRIVAVGPGFSVSGEGIALSVGLEGQSVRVRTESGRLVSGLAVGPRRVEIAL